MDNITAKVSCFARAYHYQNNTAWIFEDPMAEKLLGEEYNQIAQNMMNGIPFFLPAFKGTREEGLRIIVDRQLSPSVLARSAYCEEMLNAETGNGCTQYLLFAAGYDTFSLRNRNPMLQVYELDFPDVLQDKKRRIHSLGLNSSAKYVPCDLSKDFWKRELKKVGYDSGKKTFGSLLGISYYLNSEDFKNLLHTIYEVLADDSVICLDYPQKDESKECRTNQKLAAGAGEEMKALYSPEEMEEMLKYSGFQVRQHLNHIDMNRRYFKSYNDFKAVTYMEAPIGVGYILAGKRS